MFLSPSSDNALRSVLTFIVVVALIVGSVFVIKYFATEPYSIDTTDFEDQILYGGQIDTDGITLTNNRLFGMSTIQVTPDMIIECDSTSDAGVKTLIIEYEGKQFTVEFEVKYKVDFTSNGKVISSQIVSSSSELIAPEVAVEPGYEFVGWDFDFSANELDGNKIINAVFEEIDYPPLSDLTATYGDTLGDVELPSNELGAWEFLKSSTTSVGDAGRNKFGVRFVLTDGTVAKSTTVNVNVQKRMLEFTDILDSFTYDGKEHFPTYSLSEDVSVVAIGSPAVNAGEYSFSLEIKDKNYEGKYTGKFTITKPDVTVTVSSASITYGDAVPEFTYTVEGFEDVALLGVTLNVPEFASMAGVIEITATVANANVNATVVNGYLTVEKGQFTPQQPTLNGAAVYGDKISTLTFATVGMGKWVWEDPDIVIDDMSGVSAWAVFIPENSNNQEVRQLISITDILKRELKINVTVTTFTYTEGVEYSISYVIEDGSYTDVKVVGNTSESNAGTYLKTLVIEDERYFGSVSVDLVISKADPEIEFSFTLDGVWRPGIQLGDIALPDGFKWEAPGTVLENCGEGEYSARYDLEDPNYNVLYGTLRIDLAKADGKISGVQESYDRIYDGSVYTVPGIIPNHTESTLVYEYVLDGRIVDEIWSAGVYTVTVTLPESANYTRASVTFTVNVTKGDNLDSVITTQNATYLDKLSSLILPTSTIGTWSWKDADESTTVGDAGVHTFIAVFTPATANHNVREVEVTVNVAKKAITDIPALLNDSIVYSGVVRKPNINRIDNTLYTVTNEGGLDVGSYSVILTLIDPDNYKWFDSDEQTKELPYSIVKANASVSGLAIDGWKYGESASFPVASTNLGTIKYVYSSSFGGEYTTAVPTNAGTYYVKAIVQGTDNYNGFESDPVSFVIAKDVVSVLPVITDTDLVYTGSVIYPTLTGVDDAMYTVTNEGGTNVGSHTVTLTLKDPVNYKWQDSDEATKTLGYSVVKADAVISDLVLNGWTYGQSAGIPSADTSFGTVSYVYSATVDGEYTATKPTGAGTYYVKAIVAGTANYNGAESAPVSFTIEKSSASITGLNPTYALTYTGEYFTVTDIIKSHGESELVYTLDGVSVDKISVIDAGTYSVVVTLPESANYLAATAEATITVSPAENSIDYVNTNQNAIYLDKVTSLTLPVSNVGAWSWKNVDENTVVGNVGTHTFVAVFTPANGNYLAKEVEVTVNVAKKAVSAIPTLNATSLIYTGYTVKPEVIGVDSTLYTVTNDGGVDVGSYGVALTLIDPDNYKWSDSDEATKIIGYSITKAQVYIPFITINGWTYGQSAKAPTSTSNFGTVRFVYSSSYAGEYTSEVPYLAGNYYVKGIVDGTDNYYGAETEPVGFTIAKATVTLPTLDSTEFIYTGTTLKPTLGGIDDALYTVTNDGGVNVGSYEVALTLIDPDNYKWPDSNEQTKILGYSIVKADAVISGLAMSGWTYGQSASVPSASATFGTLSYVYSATVDGEYTVTKPTGAGTYFVKAIVADSSNWNGAQSAPVSFTIAKASASITGLYAEYTHTYDGESFNITGLGKSHGESSFVYTVNGEVVDKISVINAGVYSVVVTLPESDNYLEATAEATITVLAAENTIDAVNTNQNAIYLDKLLSLALPESTIGTWSWKDASAETTVGNVGTHTFVAVFTPATTNYLAKEVDVTVNVAKKAINLPVVTDKEYTGDHIISGLVTNDLYEVIEDDGGVDRGIYSVTVALVDSQNYRWSTTTENTVSISYQIAAAINNWSVLPDVSDAVYGDALTIYGEAAHGDYEIWYKLMSAADSDYTMTAPTTPGEYTAKFITTDDNYSILTQLVTFKISKKVVTLPTLSGVAFTYTGLTVKPEIIGVDDALYTVTNDGGVDVGSYAVTLTLIHPENYKWSDTEDAAKDIGYSIIKAQVYIPFITINGWTYGQSAKAPTSTSNFGTVRFVYSATYAGEYTSTVPLLAGSYYVKGIVDGTDNYYGAETDPCAFTISKATVTLPTLDSTEFTYTGTTLKPTLGGVDDTLYTVTNEGGVSVDDYTVTLTLKDSANYKWPDSDDATITIGYFIVKADAVISDLVLDGWTYGQTAGIPSASTTFGTLSYVYSATVDGEYTATKPTGAGTYYVKAIVADSSNWNGTQSAPVSFTIAKAEASITGLNATYQFTYDGNVYTVPNPGRSHGESELVITINGQSASSISVTDAGVYTVVVTLPESANYLEATAEAIITVLAAENTIDIVNTNQSATYLDKLYDLALPESTIGAWTWKDADENTTVGNAGTNTFVAVFTPATSNYLAKEVEVTVNVAKKAITAIPTLNATSFTYTKYNVKPEVIGADETLYTVTNDGGVDVGNYFVTLTLIDSANYKWFDSDEETMTIGYSITKATAVIVPLTAQGWTYGGSYKLPTTSSSFGTVRFVYSSSYAGEYVSTVPTLAGNYYVKGIVDGTDNYYGAQSAPVAFTISKAVVTLPTLESYEIPYTGSVVKATIVNPDETLYSISNVGGMYVGDNCTVFLTLNDTDNYVWSHTEDANATIHYEIVKASPTIENVAIDGWTFGESANAPGGTSDFGSVSYVYSATVDGEYTSAVPTTAGTYYVKATVAGSSNWNGAQSAPVSFTIAKAEASITGLNATYQFTYNGNAYTVPNPGRSHGESEFVITINGQSASSISVTDAGVYTVVVTLPESANYLETTAETTVTVLAAENTRDTVNVNQSATYLDKLSSLTLPTSTIGTWSWKGADASTTVGNAGTNKHIALFTPATGNYLAKEVEVTVTVAKKDVTSIPAITQNSFTYTGSEIKPTVNNVDTTLCQVSYPGSINVGSYVVTVSLKDTANYKWAGGDSSNKTYAYSITKGTPNITGFSIPATEYGAPIVPVVTVDFGSYVVLYASSEGGEYTATAPTEIGQHWAKLVIAETANYNAASAGPVSFNITKATPIVTFTPTTPSTSGQYYQNLLDFNKDTAATNKKGEKVTGTLGNVKVTFNGASSTYSFIFKPTDTAHYNETTISGTINLKTVATIGVNGTAYGTIEEALRNAGSGKTVWVVTDNTGNVYITEKEVTVNSGVTLLIPYGNASSVDGRNQSGESTLFINTETGLYMSLAKEHPEYRQTVVTLAEGVTLTVAGTLEISGELTGGGGGNMAGHTAGKYAELILQHNSKIVVDGVAKVYGYISNEDDSGDPGTLVTVKQGATLCQPFTLVDFRGGSILKAVNDNITSMKNHPFCQFKFVNVSVKTRYDFGAKMNVWANLDTGKLIGDGSQHNFKEVTFIGTGGVIELTHNKYSYLVAKYDPSTEIIDVDIYGGAKNNAMELTVTAGLSTVTVSSSTYFFGISWYYDISLDNNADLGQTTAQFSLDYFYKMMPGSKLTVEEGAILNVNELTIYDVFNDPIYNTDNGAITCPYPTVYPASSSLSGQSIPHAIVTVRGGIVASKLAGDVYADSNGATLIVNNATTIVTYELEKHSGNVLAASAGSYLPVTKDLRLIYNNELTTFVIGETYMTINGLWAIGVDYITIEIPDGVTYVAEQTVTLDENGIPTKAGATSGTGGTIHIVRGSLLTLNLSAGQIAIDDPSIYEISGIDAFNALSSATESVKLYPASSGALNIYTIPLFELAGSGITGCSVKYYNIDKPDEMYAVVEFVKEYTSSKSTIEISISVSGIDSSRLTAVSGSLSGSKCTATGSKTTVTAKVQAKIENADFASVTKITATGSVDKDECITPDSLITLADGTQVRVDSLTGDELLLVWNLETGMFDYAPIMFVDSDPVDAFDVIYLYFSDGTLVKVIGEHGFWDYDLNKYVYLDENAAEYIGHTFARQNGDELSKVQLVNVEIKTEMTSAWSPVTVGHLCYFVNGMLTMPGGVGGLFNIFEVDAETMTYDYEAIERDIETYGLFTYEELNAICPLTEEMFYAAGGQYLKISIGKGNLTMDELIYMIERYSIYV